MDTFFGCGIAGADYQYVQGTVQRFHAALTTFIKAEPPTGGDENQRNTKAEAFSSAAAEVLCSACRYLAACQSAGLKYLQFIESDQQFKAELEGLDLMEWLARLDFDLVRMRVGFSSPMQSEPVITLQHHLERLFWARGTVLISKNGGYILPFADPNITYSRIASHLEQNINEQVPIDLFEQLENMLTQIK